MKAVIVLFAVLSVACAQYTINLPEVFSSKVYINSTGEHSLFLQGRYYVDQGANAARIDTEATQNIDGVIQVFGHSTIVDVNNDRAYNIILNPAEGTALECVVEPYTSPFDLSQLFYQQFIETTYFRSHLVDHVVNKSSNTNEAYIDRFLQIPVRIILYDQFSSITADYEDLTTTVPEICQNQTSAVDAMKRMNMHPTTYKVLQRAVRAALFTPF